MAKAKTIPVSFTRIVSGIADFDKESVLPDAVAFARQIDFRTDPRRWTILPKTVKESGSVIVGLPLWGDRVGSDTYIYDDVGNLYKRTTDGVVTLLRSVADSSGNGLKYFGEDDFLYYPTNTSIGRYGRLSGTPSFVDDFLTAEGGVPTNTYSLDLESGSSQYATAADSASLSITSDLAIEVNFKPESLPTAGNEMVLVAKWDKNSDERSYKFSVYAVSGYFGDGSDGALTISSNTTEAPIDSACSGTSDTNSLSATNASFAIGQIVLIHQTRGSGAGTYQRNKITGYTAGTMTLENNLNYSYTTGAQVRVLKQYTNVTIDSGVTYTAKAWDGTVGGILSFIANGTVTSTGTISATGKGFVGGTAVSGSPYASGRNGEGSAGAGQSQTRSANGNSGGGGQSQASPYWEGGGGGGGGNGTVGEDAPASSAFEGFGGYGGTTVGTSDLTTMVFGGSGGSGGIGKNSATSGAGGNGGGIIFITASTITVTGSIVSNGGNGSNSNESQTGGGGAGSGGSILLKAQTATLGTGLVTASAGSYGTASDGSNRGGNGGSGRIHLDYYTSYSGTTTPTLDVTQDTSLVTNTTYQLRLMVSSDGTVEESMTKSLSSIVADTYGHYACSWDASAHETEFFENGVSLGVSTGTATAIYNSSALLTVGASLNASSAAENFADGKVDDIRIWNTERTEAQILGNKGNEMVGTESGLVAYYKLNNSASDTTANANNLTLQNSPVYSTDVAFSSPTTRLDIDQQDSSTGNTYALGTSIDEGNSHRQTFVPSKDPQKSIAVYISAKGSSASWTLVVHDALNREIASKTIANASLNTGHMEFIFDEPWTPVIGASYHFHVYASNTTGTPAVVSGTSSNLETGQFISYYQFLVEDIYHPIEQTLNFLSIGNGRYVAKWDASSYNPHRLTFPSGWRIRCIAKWREYFAYGCWKGDTIYDYDQGIIFFWDGYSDTYNFFIEIPQGAVNSMFGSQGVLYIVAGYQGDILEYTGGDKAYKVKRLPKITSDKYVEVLPGALTMWRTLLHIGVGVTDSTEVEQAVYSWGKRNESYVDSLSNDYIISTGTTKSTGVKIGLIMPVNKKLLIGWKDNTAYGLDSVDPSGTPYSSGSIEWMIRDENALWKEKKPEVIRSDFDPLENGHSIGLQYKLDRDDNWSSEETATYSATEEMTKLRLQPVFARHREYQVRLNLYTSISTSPTALGVTVMEDALSDEEYV